MHLTRALMFYVKRQRTPGKIDIGKHQLVQPLTAQMKAACLTKLMEERHNLSLLQRPYLSEAEEECSVLADANRQEEFLALKEAKVFDKMLKDSLMDDHLSHLNVTKNWE